MTTSANNTLRSFTASDYSSYAGAEGDHPMIVKLTSDHPLFKEISNELQENIEVRLPTSTGYERDEEVALLEDGDYQVDIVVDDNAVGILVSAGSDVYYGLVNCSHEEGKVLVESWLSNPADADLPEFSMS